ncbi:hypothetical protein ACHWQZ_G003950 [Mnemiopsis leidyi]
MLAQQSNLASTPVSKVKRPSLPCPLISENLSFSRKEKWESERTPEPSKPLHRYHTVSRICSKRSLFSGPKVLGGIDSDSFLSTPGYSDKAKQTYLQQCFQTTKILGEGSFGRVYKCKDKADGKEYAVKVSEKYNSLAVEEVKKHEALSEHPNCVKFYKAWEEGRSLFIQMELCDESLASFVKRSNEKLNECEIWRILHHCLSGLGHFHSNNLLHMDIKPDNIFRSTTANSVMYKLGDFGLSVTVNDLNKTDIIEGDSKYLAPELLDKRCDEKADIFSLGISMLEIMSDVELPNNGPVWHSLRNGDLPPTPGYSPTLRQIITLMVNKDPDYRPNVTQLLSDPSVKCYSWVNLFKDWREYLRSKGSSVISTIWGNTAEEHISKDGEDILEGMEDIEDDNEDSGDFRLSHFTPTLVKKVKESHTPAASPNLSAHLITSLHGSPRMWPGSPALSPVPSASRSALALSNNFESSTPNKSLFNNFNDSESDQEGGPPDRPSIMLKRNLLDSFADQDDEDGDSF